MNEKQKAKVYYYQDKKGYWRQYWTLDNLTSWPGFTYGSDSDGLYGAKCEMRMYGRRGYFSMMRYY